MQFPSVDELKARSTRKWTVFDDDVIPLWIAESDFPTAPVVREAIEARVATESFGYTPAPSACGLSKAVSDFYAERFGWEPGAENVVWIGDVVRGMLLGLQYFTRPGTPVIVPVPAYPPFLELAETAGREMIPVDVSNGFDLAAIERAFQQGAGSLALANPYNPMGYVLDEETLRGLVDVAVKYDARILSDEIHAPIVFDGRHIPIASLGEDAARVSYTVIAASKAWNIAGLKCAQIIFSNPEDLTTWNNLTGVAKDGTGTLGVFASEACYTHGGAYLDEELAYLRANRDWLIKKLPQAIPGIGIDIPAATYLMWLDFRSTTIPDKENPARWLRTHAKVALNEGTAFGPGGAGHVRLNFATSRELLDEAVSRIAAALPPTTDAT